MQQGLLSGFNPSDALMPPAQQSYRGLLSRLEQRDKGGAGISPYQVSAFGSAFLPSAGISDVLGFAPDPNVVGGTLPSFTQNIDQGNYIDAGLQTLGASGDVMLASAPFAPFLLAPAVGAKLISQFGKSVRGASKVAPETGLLGKTNEIIPDNGLLGKVDNVQPQTGIAEVVPPTDKSDGIFAFHGSGADFDEFKLSKIGTGEGAQAFGYGLYFTDSKDIAKFYKTHLSKEVDIDGKPFIRGNKHYPEILKNESLSDNLSSTNGDLEKAIKYIEETLNEMKELKNVNGIETYSKELKDLKELRGKVKVRENTGKTYEVKIKAVMDDLIDYDKSLRQQNDKVKKILKPYYEYYMVAETADFGTLLESAYRHLPQDEFSERLAKEGIKGIKYQSGQLSGITDSKATNYVIFDDKIIDIMAKYGIVGAVGVTAMQGRGNQSPEADLSL